MEPGAPRRIHSGGEHRQSLFLVLLPLQDRGSAGALRRVFRPAYCIPVFAVLMPRGFCGVSASLGDGAADMGLALLLLRAEEGRSLASAGCLVGDSGASKLVFAMGGGIIVLSY